MTAPVPPECDPERVEAMARAMWNALPATPYGWDGAPEEDRAQWRRLVVAAVAADPSPAVTPAEITRQQSLGWPDFHPETFCHLCGGRNVYSWHAPNEVWNQLRAAGVLPDTDIVCPQCFTDLAGKVGIEPSVWQLVNGDGPSPAEEALREFAEWVLSITDDPPARRTVTLEQIVQRAALACDPDLRAALASPAPAPQAEEVR